MSSINTRDPDGNLIFLMQYIFNILFYYRIMSVAFAKHDRSLLAATSYETIEILTLKYNK